MCELFTTSNNALNIQSIRILHKNSQKCRRESASFAFLRLTKFCWIKTCGKQCSSIRSGQDSTKLSILKIYVNVAYKREVLFFCPLLTSTYSSYEYSCIFACKSANGGNLLEKLSILSWQNTSISAQIFTNVMLSLDFLGNFVQIFLISLVKWNHGEN